MKIQDLLELVDTKYQTQKYRGNFRQGNDNDRSARGQGAFSTVRDDRTDPHMVRKHNHTPQDMDSGDHDNYSNFVTMLINSKQMDNPAFPKVYNMKKMSDDWGKAVFSYKLEKLLTRKEVSDEEITAVADRVLVNPPNDADGMQTHNLMARVIDRAIESGDYSELKDENIIAACKLVTRMAHTLRHKDIDFIIDMNAGNLMYRRTRYGIQPVITDPLA